MTPRQQAVTFFVRFGWTLEQACGIVANLEAESGLRPDAVGDNGTAYGLAQWRGERQSHFEALIGKPLRGASFEDQLAFVHAELTHVGWENKAGEALAKCTTPAEAAAVICKLYERPADSISESVKRSARAEAIYAEMKSYPAPENAPEPIIPPAESTMPFPALLLPLLQSIIPVLGARVAPRIDKVLKTPGVGETFVADFFAQLQQITGMPNPTQAAAALERATPETIKQAENMALEQLDRLVPIMDRAHQYQREEWTASEESIDRAAARSIQQQAVDGGPFANPTFMIAIFILTLVAVVVGAVLFKGGFSTDMQAFVIGAVVGSALTAVLGFYFGSSRTSSAKDATIAQLANK